MRMLMHSKVRNLIKVPLNQRAQIWLPFPWLNSLTMYMVQKQCTLYNIHILLSPPGNSKTANVWNSRQGEFLETGSPIAVPAGLKLEILLPQSPQCWDYKPAPPHLTDVFCFKNWHSLFFHRNATSEGAAEPERGTLWGELQFPWTSVSFTCWGLSMALGGIVELSF
jgi:hypothetical protein